MNFLTNKKIKNQLKYCAKDNHIHISRRYGYKQNKSKRYQKYQKGRFLASGPNPLQQL